MPTTTHPRPSRKRNPIIHGHHASTRAVTPLPVGHLTPTQVKEAAKELHVWRMIVEQCKPFPPTPEDGQLHAGDCAHAQGEKLYHTDSEGRYWCGYTHRRPPADLLAECQSTIRDLLRNHPELESGT